MDAQHRVKDSREVFVSLDFTNEARSRNLDLHCLS